MQACDLRVNAVISNWIDPDCALQGSVMEGKGRKLQGSEQIRFRAAIMRQTGFLEKSDDSHKRQDSPAVTVR